MKVLFLYNRPRQALHDACERGEAPDELLYGLRTVRKFGVDSHFTDAGLARRLGAPFFNAIERIVSKRGKRIGFNLSQSLNLKNELNQYDLIFATADSNALPVLFLKSLGVVGTPVVYGTIGLAEAFRNAPASPVFRFVRNLLPYAERIVHYGHGEGQILREQYGVPDEKLRFVRLGTQVDIFREARNGQSENFILTFGVDRRRDWRTFLRATKGLNLRLKIVTDPILLRGLSWPPNVEVHPLMSISALRDLISRALFVVFPVEANCYSAATFSLLQSMAAGKTVIVSATDAITKGYDFDFGRELIGVKPGDPVALRLWIKALLADPERIKQTGRLAAERVEKSFTIEDYARRIVDVFEEIG